MHRASTKAAAEAALRELPSVLGAFVREDIHGNPREIHVLIRSGPDAGALARDIHDLLEERLDIPIDQRVISIAQLDEEMFTDEDPDVGTTAVAGTARAPAVPRSNARAVFRGIESTVERGRIVVGVTLDWSGESYTGTAEEVETANGRARAAVAATLKAAVAAAWEGLRLELDLVAVVPSLDQSFVLVSILGLAPALGRKPLALVGAQPVETDIESAAALATLKAINRVLSLGLG
jgi:hypothetical protein